MTVLWGNFLAGTTTNNPLAVGGTTLTSTELATLPTVTSPDVMWIVLDPRSLQAGREIVLVTDHAASSTSATITRAQQDTSALSHPLGTEWIVGVTKSDLEGFLLRAGGTITGSLIVGGDLTVNGTTVTVNSTTITVDDPILTLGGDTAPVADDSKDRGIEFRWHTGGSAKIGFFGFDDSTGKFTFIPDATNTSEVFSGTKGELDANVDWSNILSKPDPVVTVTLAGAVTGTANATLTDLGNGTITVTTSPAADAFTLGTHTTGQYVSDVTGTSNQVVATPTGTEPRTVVLSLPQDIHVAATPTFGRVTLSQATGTAPLSVSSTTVVANLNADMLDGKHDTHFAAQESLEAVMGDLLYVGLYDATSYDGTDLTKPVPTWSGLATVYRHGMYWIVSASDTLDFIDADLSGRFEFGVDDEVLVSNGDWVVATNPTHDPDNPNVDLDLADITFQVLPFSAETFVKAKIDEHVANASDPHSAAGYLTRASADPVYSQIGHTHEMEIGSAISDHVAEADPHSQYLTESAAAQAYSALGHTHDDRYEAAGAISAHAAQADPHSQYLTAGEADSVYAPLAHSTRSDHDGRYSPLGHTHEIPDEVLASDGAQSARIFVGSTTPSSPAVGDIWVECANISLQVPDAPAPFSGASSAGTTASLMWAAWATAASVTRVRLQRKLSTGSWGTPADITTLYDDSVAPFNTSYSDSGLTENTAYDYRLWATNATGDGSYGYVALTTANDAPGVPTSLGTSSVTSTGITLSWTAPSPFLDPATNRYEVFKNGLSVGVTNSVSYAFGGLTENTTYSLGVRSADSGGLTSSIVTASQATSNGNPPNVSGLSVTDQNYNQIAASWSAVSGISDFANYEVKLYLTSGMSLQQTVTTSSLSHVFTGLSYSTGYTVEVRAVDLGGLKSSSAASGADTTQANPDTTAPANATITSFKPESSYGNMVLRGTWPSDGDLTSATVQRSTDGSTWSTDITYSGGSAPTPSAAFNRTLGGGPYSAGQTVHCRVIVTDASGNSRTGATQSYTLVTSPAYVAADATNSWRNTSGGEYNAAGNYRLYQGYYSNAAWNARGLWYYGTKVQDQISYSGRRTVTQTRVFVQRNTAGSSADLDVYFCMHAEVSSPGTVSGVGAPTLSETPTSLITLRMPAFGSDYNGWATLPSGWAGDLIDGTYRGVAVYIAAGSPYLALDSVGENSFSGLLEFTHLG